jgi:hypothetical protein
MDRVAVSTVALVPPFIDPPSWALGSGWVAGWNTIEPIRSVEREGETHCWVLRRHRLLSTIAVTWFLTPACVGGGSWVVVCGGVLSVA